MLQTTHSLIESADMVREAQGSSTKAKLKQLEQALGLTYNRDAIIWNDSLRLVARFPVTVAWDWMHCICASGGVAQHSLAEIVGIIVRAGIPVSQLDEFAQSVCHPRSWGKFSKRFFAERFVVGSGGCSFSGFASEVLPIVTVLRLFTDTTIRPSGSLANVVQYLDSLWDLLSALMSGDAVLDDLPGLRFKLRAHHILFCQMFSEHVRPKLQYMTHLAQCFQEQRCNVSCFVTERKHRSLKETAARSFGNCASSVLSREIFSHMEHMQDERSFVPSYLIGRSCGPPE